jgi:hypothetical protein
MSKKQHEKEEVSVKYKLDSSSEASSKKLDSKSFKDAVLREAEMILSQKVRSTSRSS